MNRLVVLKVGGSLGGTHLDAVASSVQALSEANVPVVLVHGGGPRITAALAEQGIEGQFLNGQRITSPQAMSVVERVLGTEVNGEIVDALRSAGVSARGLSGGNEMLYVAPIEGLQRVGRVKHVVPTSILREIDHGVTPVVAPIGCDEAGLRFNINADLAASALASHLHATRVVFLTDVPGIYSNFAEKVLLMDTTVGELEQHRRDGAFSTGMIPKVDAVESALYGGVDDAYVVHGANVDAVRFASTCGLIPGEWGHRPEATRVRRHA